MAMSRGKEKIILPINFEAIIDISTLIRNAILLGCLSLIN